MSATVLSFFRPAPTTSGDWSQQELAEFYRVEAASIQAGLRLSLDRGVTDEGDPWLVFCREDGEVFLHFARIDGSYVIVSDMVGEPLVGPDFRTLLADLVTRNPSVLPINRLGHGAPGARAGAQILMHPAALLAAIVATTCLLSSMNEAVASEMKSTPLLDSAPGDGGEVHHGSASLSAVDERHVIDEDAARSRVTEQRALAVSTSVVMACIASVLDQSTAHHAPQTQIKLTQIESLASSAPDSSTASRLAMDDGRYTDRAHGAGEWADARPGSQQPTPFTPTAHQPSLSRDSAIMLSAPNAGIAAPGLDGVSFFAKTGATGSASASQSLWPSLDVARLMAVHAREASAATTKGGASPAPAAASGTGVEPGAGADGGASSPPTNDADPPRESARPTASPEKILATSAGTGQGTGSTANTPGTASSLASSGADVASKVAATGSHDAGSSTAATSIKSAAIVLSVDTVLGTAAQVVNEIAKSQGVLSPLQNLGSLSAKTVSLFLHTLIGDTLFVGAAEGNTGSSSAPDLLKFDGASAAKLGQDLSATDSATVIATAGSTTAATVTAPVSATKTAAGTPALPVSGDHTTADATANPAAPTAQTTHSDPAHGASPAAPTTLPAMASGSGGQAAAPAQGAQAGATDPSHATTVAGGTVAATVPTASATPTAEKTGTGVKGADGLSSPEAGTQTEAQHVVALQTVSALVSSTNTISKAISISLVTGTTLLDAAQLKLIDTFMSSTPNVKIVATENTLEIYDPSALNNPDVHAMNWDLGGGSTIKVVGLTDAHPL